MRLKQYVPYLFIFLLLFVNVIPNLLVTNLSITGNSISNILIQFLTALNYTSYLKGAMHVILLIIVINYLKTNLCSDRLIMAFSLIYSLIILINITMSNSNITPIINEVYPESLISVYEKVSLINAVISLALFISLSIIFIIILIQIKHTLSHFYILIITTFLYVISYVIIPIVMYASKDSVAETINNHTIYGYISLIVVILFKLGLIYEALSNTQNYLSENN